MDDIFSSPDVDAPSELTISFTLWWQESSQVYDNISPSNGRDYSLSIGDITFHLLNAFKTGKIGNRQVEDPYPVASIM